MMKTLASTTTPVRVREVGLRDGLQILPRVLPTAHQLEWIRAAHAAGLREIEVDSFMPPKLMPQLADTAELVAYARTLPGLMEPAAASPPSTWRISLPAWACPPGSIATR